MPDIDEKVFYAPSSFAGLEEVTQGSLSQEELDALLQALARHYGEPVMNIGRYCDAFETWLNQVEGHRGTSSHPDRDEALHRIGEVAGLLRTYIQKSNLLFRLIYQDQPLRTEMCPEHKGKWSGYNELGNHPCECQDGWDLTGWLPNHELSIGERIALFAKDQDWPPATFLMHTEVSPQYDANEPCVANAGGITCRGATVEEATERLADALAEKGFQR